MEGGLLLFHQVEFRGFNSLIVIEIGVYSGMALIPTRPQVQFFQCRLIGSLAWITSDW